MSDKSLAMALDMSRRNKKKMAKGGAVSAKTESRPMLSEKTNDSKMVAQNDSRKVNSESGWTDKPTITQAQKPSLTKLSRPGLVSSSVIKPRLSSDVREEMLRQHEEHLMRMAEGGEIEPSVDEDMSEHKNQMLEISRPEMEEDKHRDEELPSEDHDSIASAIMSKRKRMAEGGQVDIDHNNQEEPNSLYEMNEDAALKENLDSDMMSVSQPENSNEHGDEIESDIRDMVSKIRSKMNMQRQFKG